MSKYIQSKDLAWNFLGQRVIAFTFTAEREFHTLNETAAVVFAALKDSRTRSELLQIVCDEFEVDEVSAAADLDQTLVEMLSKKLIDQL